MFTVPPPDMQLIIDKMASYVAKNGRDFEAIVRSKGKVKTCIFLYRQACHNLKTKNSVVVNTSSLTENENLVSSFIFHNFCAVVIFVDLCCIFKLFV
jgi:hypothetical protein